MSFRRDLINNMINDMNDKFANGDVYKTHPKILDHIQDPTKVTQFPSLAVGYYADLIDEEGNGHMRRFSQILVYGYANSLDDLFEMAEDVEYYLYHNDSDFIYKSQVQPIAGEGLNFRYTGVASRTNVFTFDTIFGLYYTQNLNP